MKLGSVRGYLVLVKNVDDIVLPFTVGLGDIFDRGVIPTSANCTAAFPMYRHPVANVIVWLFGGKSAVGRAGTT